MTLQGIQLDVLQTLADIQAVTSLAEVEDVQIAEDVELDLTIVRSLLDTLATAGYVQLERVETLAGIAYNASATGKGRAILAESQRQVSERLQQLK